MSDDCNKSAEVNGSEPFAEARGSATVCPTCGQQWNPDGTVAVMSKVWCSSCLTKMQNLHAGDNYAESPNDQALRSAPTADAERKGNDE